NAINELIAYNSRFAQDKAGHAHQVLEQTNRISLVMTGLIALLMLLSGYLIVRSLMRQLGGEPAMAADVANRIARGDVSSEIRLRDGDRTSLMAAMHEMQKAIKSVIAEQMRVSGEYRSGNFAARMDANRFDGSFRTMAENINSMAVSQTELMQKVAQCLAEFSK